MTTEKFYGQIHGWFDGILEEETKRPLVVGVSAPQGAGKTTLTKALVSKFNSRKVNAVSISIDDFYLTNAQQKKLAAENPEREDWQQRGYPGTHDIPLGTETLRVLKDLRAGQKCFVPRYDKSAFDGQGDRYPESEWTRVSGPLDLVLFEGWMVGFDAPGYDVWWKQLDALLYLHARDYHYVLEWRVEAEQKMRASGKPGMSDEETRAYAEKFMPAYERWADSVIRTVRAHKLGYFLDIQIEKNRLPKTKI